MLDQKGHPPDESLWVVYTVLGRQLFNFYDKAVAKVIEILDQLNYLANSGFRAKL